MADVDKDSLIISKVTPADEKSYIDFLQEAYKDQFNNYRFESRCEIKEFWRWEYVENPHKIAEKPLVWICRVGENIVGQLCVMPVTVKINNRSYGGGWCQDFMVLPEFRGMGIGQKLVREVKRGLNDTVDVVMAIIATERSRAIFRKQGFIEMGEINKNVAVKAASKILLSIRKVGVGRNVDIQEANTFDVEFNRLWEYVSNKFNCLVKRDEEVLKWRFAPQRHWTYRAFIAKENGIPKGYVIVKEKSCRRIRQKSLSTGTISDIFFDPSETYIGRALIETALNVMKKRTSLVRCDVMNPSAKQFLRSIGFIDIKSSNMFLLCLSERMAKEDISLARKRDNWYLTYGDSDLDLS